MRKKHFIPRGSARGIGLRGFLIKSDARRGVSNGNMHVRPRDFAGGGEACSVCKTGVRLDNDGIHPSIHPSYRAEVGTLRRGENDEKKIFFLPSYPSASMGLYRNQEDMERISNSVSREISPRTVYVRGKFFAKVLVHRTCLLIDI